MSCACVRACVRVHKCVLYLIKMFHVVCVRACVHACVHVCMRACVRMYISVTFITDCRLITTSPTSYDVTLGDSHTFHCNSNRQITWKSDVPDSRLPYSGATLVLNEVHEYHTGHYYCTPRRRTVHRQCSFTWTFSTTGVRANMFPFHATKFNRIAARHHSI